MLASFGAFVAAAAAFGFVAHQIIGQVAWSLLSVEQRAAVKDRFLFSSRDTLEKAATWPDEIKHAPLYAWTQPLHYINLNDHPPDQCTGKRFKAAEPNLLSACFNYTVRMTGPHPSRETFAFMVHFISDLHMPLHGSLYLLQWGLDV